MHATSTNFECNIHEEVDTESSNPYRQLILDAVGLDLMQLGLSLMQRIWRKYLIPMHKSFMLCLVQLIKNYGMIVLNIPRCQRLHDCCI